MKYLWVKEPKTSTETVLEIVTDPIALYHSGRFDPRTDQIFQIGNEIKVKVVTEVVPSKREIETSGISRGVRTMELRRDDLGNPTEKWQDIIYDESGTPIGKINNSGV